MMSVRGHRSLGIVTRVVLEYGRVKYGPIKGQFDTVHRELAAHCSEERNDHKRKVHPFSGVPVQLPRGGTSGASIENGRLRKAAKLSAKRDAYRVLDELVISLSRSDGCISLETKPFARDFPGGVLSVKSRIIRGKRRLESKGNLTESRVWPDTRIQ
ncbi:hypothetical protein KM043_017826 [Ampulex compressa]|nr:hypothetical protein KM043_017826 [Ampulex compressa]